MQVKQPQMINVQDLQKADLFFAEARFERVLFANVVAVGVKASNMHVEESMLQKVLFVEAKLEKLTLMDVQLKGCDFSATACTDSSIIRATFSGCRMTGVDFGQASLGDVTFENCKLDMANFRFAKLNQVHFIDCELTEADFQAAQLTNVRFEDCHLEKTEFAQCRVQASDARGSHLIDIRGWQNLKGLKLDSAQLASVAPQLAVALGIIVE